MKSGKRDMLRGRMNIYFWLSSFYIGPSPSVLSGLLQPSVIRSLSELFNSLAPSDFSRFRQKVEHVDDGLLEEINEEYNQLFVVPRLGSYVPPYESCFTEMHAIGEGKFGELWGDAATEVEDFYRKARLEAKLESSSPPDHLGLELNFMATLCREEMESCQEGNEDSIGELADLQLSFLRNHLVKWIGVFRGNVEKSPASKLYKDIAALTEAFLARDAEYLSSFPKKVV